MIRSIRLSCMLMPLVLVLTAPVASATEKTAVDNAARAIFALGLAGFERNIGAAGGLLSPGGRVIRHVHLTEGDRVVVAAGGCDDAFDVDVVVFDPAGNLVAKDTSYSRGAAVLLDVPTSGLYAVAVIMARSTYDGAHWTVLVAGEGEQAARRRSGSTPARWH